MSELEESVNVESGSYPAYTLDSTISFANEIVAQRGENFLLNRKDLSILLGKSESYLNLKLSAGVQYGILINVFGKGYKISDLYQKITSPVYPKDAEQAKLIAITNPSLYKKIIDGHNGKILPNEEGFCNLLKTDFKLNPNSVLRATKVFFENCEDLKIIDPSKRLRYFLPHISNSDVNVSNGHTNGSADNDLKNKNEDQKKEYLKQGIENPLEILIPLKNGRKAFLLIPEDYTDEELTRVSKFVEALK